MKRLRSLVLSILLILPLFSVKTFAASVILSDTQIAQTAAQYSIAEGTKAYQALQAINSYADQVSADGTLIFFFEGVNHDYLDANDRTNALCVVIKGGQVVYLDQMSSTIPDFPFDTSLNYGNPVGTVKSGVYSFTTINNDGSYNYGCLNINQAQTVRMYNQTDWAHGASTSSIQIHTRNATTPYADAPSSRGCVLVGANSRQYVQFGKAVGIFDQSLSESAWNTPYQYEVSGTVVIDQSFATDYLKTIGYPDEVIAVLQNGTGSGSLTGTNPAGGSDEPVESDESETSDPAIFSDVADASAYYYKAVYWAAENVITKGYPDGSFGPQLACTRAHAVTFLWRLAGEPAPSGSVTAFPDVKKSDYYYKAVQWAAEQGITKGYADGTFRPDDTCLREHVVTFLWRYAGKPNVTDGTTFSDVSSNAYYAKAVQWAAKTGVTHGYGDGTFGPERDCLREHVVTFLYRYAN